MLKTAVFVGIIWCLIRIITIIIILSGQSGKWSPLYGIGHIIAVIQGFWVLIDVFMIIGARKKIKAFLMVWIIFSIIRLVGYIYNCIKIGTSSMILLGLNIGSFFLLIISCVPVGLCIYKLDEERHQLAEDLKENDQRRSFIDNLI